MKFVIGLFLFVGIYLLVQYLRRPHLYTQHASENIEKFLSVLLIRGTYQGILMVYDSEIERYLYFTKYKVKGKGVLSLNVPNFNSFGKKKEKLVPLFETLHLDYFNEEIDDKNADSIYTIELKQNLSLGNRICRIILNEVFEVKLTDEINLFYKRVNYDPDVVVGFKEIPEDIKERFDVGIPITNSGYISNKIGFFFGKLFRKFIK